MERVKKEMWKGTKQLLKANLTDALPTQVTNTWVVPVVLYNMIVGKLRKGDVEWLDRVVKRPGRI